ncbi:MAG: hypothetical protein IKU83_06695, partial [Lachnospiraceae bacterium]|nr:hypothetical protein [Lachnospiraceae bacterium]
IAIHESKYCPVLVREGPVVLRKQSRAQACGSNSFLDAYDKSFIVGRYCKIEAYDEAKVFATDSQVILRDKSIAYLFKKKDLPKHVLRQLNRRIFFQCPSIIATDCVCYDDAVMQAKSYPRECEAKSVISYVEKWMVEQLGYKTIIQDCEVPDAAWRPMFVSEVQPKENKKTVSLIINNAIAWERLPKLKDEKVVVTFHESFRSITVPSTFTSPLSVKGCGDVVIEASDCSVNFELEGNQTTNIICNGSNVSLFLTETEKPEKNMETGVVIHGKKCRLQIKNVSTSRPIRVIGDEWEIVNGFDPKPPKGIYIQILGYLGPAACQLTLEGNHCTLDSKENGWFHVIGEGSCLNLKKCEYVTVSGKNMEVHTHEYYCKDVSLTGSGKLFLTMEDGKEVKKQIHGSMSCWNVLVGYRIWMICRVLCSVVALVFVLPIIIGLLVYGLYYKVGVLGLNNVPILHTGLLVLFSIIGFFVWVNVLGSFEIYIFDDFFHSIKRYILKKMNQI